MSILQSFYDSIQLIDKNILFPLFTRLDHYMFHRIMKYYGADYRWNDQRSQNLDKPTYNYGYGLVHYSLIRSQRPNRVLCIGSMYGYIPYMMAKACKENGIGHVDFVDAGYDINKKTAKSFFGQGFWKTVNPKKHFAYGGVEKYISTYVMTSVRFARQSSASYDYIYLDGDHSLKGAVTNVRLFWPRLNTEGFLVFHDVDFDRDAEGLSFRHGRVWKALSFLPFKFKLTNHYSGLGFIQKMSDTDQALTRIGALR